MPELFGDSSWPLRWEVNQERLLIESAKPLAALSSAVYGGGEKRVRRIVNRHVSLSYSADDPLREIRSWLNQKKLEAKETVVLLTAAHVNEGSWCFVEEKTFRLAVFSTAGVSNAARAGNRYPVFWHKPAGSPGTINLILLIDGSLTPSAMVNAVITATEAKAAALHDLRITDRKGQPATGTTTDAIAVAATQITLDGYVHAYAGVSSPLGSAIGQAVYQTVREAIEKGRVIKKDGE
jgi:iron complex transport system ATP-binding protein